ncbi:MAG: hypothetical protein J3R72DRAFT_454159 [Linnemannia gamsii]|nr:MAG: hypothetical protein J3R72DRAFT_454159 [Linnemannia gamsii]
MEYHALHQDDTQDDTITLLERPSSSFAMSKNVNDIEDSQHQERQLATPRKLINLGGTLEWLQDFEEIARANNWSSRAKLDIIPIYMEVKSTKTWFRENLQEWSDFDSFKLAFNTRYRIDSSGQFMDAEIREEQRRDRIITIKIFLVCAFVIGGAILLAILTD